MNPTRARKLNTNQYKTGTVLYWMSRDQRVEDNWALIYAWELAKQYDTTFSVIFCLRNSFEFATERLIDFMFGGLQEVQSSLHAKNIPFHLVLGDPEDVIPNFINRNNIGILIRDFSPLQPYQQWNKKIVDKIYIPFYEVDAHNIVPVWVASPKKEYGAYTFRSKITKKLPEYLQPFPIVPTQAGKNTYNLTNFDEILKEIHFVKHVKKVDWIQPGETQAKTMMNHFIKNNISDYAIMRNDPTKQIQSNLSPYLHFGHISSQTIALLLQQISGENTAVDTFLEELIVRKELSDNYCYYEPNYDTTDGFPDWAKKSLADHLSDHRPVLYSLEELEQSKTHDELWNSAQREMTSTGKMHGYMRMYWAKKILEWSISPEMAQKNAIYLNDTYNLDGRDPNGYTGIAWSIGGVHDRPWFDREIFGKIRYMNYNGAKRKFAVEEYIKMSS